MQTTIVLSQSVFAALALVMFGLGLSLRLDDFRRLFAHPKAVAIALGLQMFVLPLVCYLIITAFGLSPLYAVGLMLLAASPGGISANLFSHLFGGNVAMNVSLTAVNTLTSIVTLPLIANWAVSHYAKSGQLVPVQTGKVVEVIALVMIPVVLGMLVSARAPRFAARMDRSVKIFSVLVLIGVVALAIVKQWSSLTSAFAELGLPVLTFNLASLLAGYYVSRGAGLDQRLATAISYEIGIHNSTLAIFIAVSVLASFEAALPAAIYSVVMYVTAPLFGWLILQRNPIHAVSPTPAVHRESST